MDVVVQSIVPPAYHEALERLVFFNGQQGHAEGAIVQAIDEYGSLGIAAGVEGLRVVVSRHSDAQCLFALVRRKGREELGAGLIYLRTSPEELVVLHIAVADRYGQSRRLTLHLVMKLLRAVRTTAHRLRGVNRVSMLYKKSRRLRIQATGSLPSQFEQVSAQTRETARPVAVRSHPVPFRPGPARGGETRPSPANA